MHFMSTRLELPSREEAVEEAVLAAAIDPSHAHIEKLLIRAQLTRHAELHLSHAGAYQLEVVADRALGHIVTKVLKQEVLSVLAGHRQLFRALVNDEPEKKRKFLGTCDSHAARGFHRRYNRPPFHCQRAPREQARLGHVDFGRFEQRDKVARLRPRCVWAANN
jgi:hypothetical protein